MTGTITVATRDLLGALTDAKQFWTRGARGPERGILLHCRDTPEGLLLGVTSTTDPDATVCASATVMADGTWTDTDAFVLTATHVDMIEAYAGNARRPESQPMHEIRLQLHDDGMRVIEDGTLIDDEYLPPSGHTELETAIKPSEWPIDAVNAAIGGQLDPDMTPCSLAVAPEWMRRVAAVSQRRGQPYRMHSGSEYRCLVSVGRDWTASLPASPLLPTRVTAGEFWNLTTTTKAA